MKIVTVIGARPQFIKAAAVSRAMKKMDDITEIIVHTGQHFNDNMSEIFFREMEIPAPNYRLEINSLSHGAMTGRMIEKIEEVLLIEKPDMVLVYGDTNSTLAGALSSRKLNIPLAHIEAGLRSFNMRMPEEINRIVTDRISDMLFCPTETAIQNLKQEGYDHFNCTIMHVGDVMLDAALYYGSMSAEKSGIMDHLKLTEGSFVVCTIHRQENTDNLDHLKAIIKALNSINKHQRVILPLHPRTRKIMEHHHLETDFSIIEPQGYFDMLELLKNCALVITDSGGMQKEAFFFNKFCITMRDETEWTELSDHQYNFLTGAHEDKIIREYQHVISRTFVKQHHFYGRGDASQKIVEAISQR